MQWRVQKIVNDKVVATEEGFMADAFENLIRAKDDTRGAAKVSLNYGQSTDFAKEKYAIHITLACDQNSSMINKAAELAVDKVKELNEVVVKRMFAG